MRTQIENSACAEVFASEGKGGSYAGNLQGPCRSSLCSPHRDVFRALLEMCLSCHCRAPSSVRFYIDYESSAKRLGLVERTVHCKNDVPKECAVRFGLWIKKQDANKVGLVCMQPAIVED